MNAPHWENVYSTRAPDTVNWFRPHLETSLRLIRHCAPDPTASIADIGGGASTLMQDLSDGGYRNLTSVDVAQTALDTARTRMGDAGRSVRWLQADVTDDNLPVSSADVWHDRAVFHFLTKPAQRLAYMRNLDQALKPGGHVIIATFGPAGPLKCSGLDVIRYDAPSLAAEFGPNFTLLETCDDLHTTPSGTQQHFIYCRFQSLPIRPASILNCPHCGVAKRVVMPENFCQFFYECTGCRAILKPQPGDCCVFCSYGSAACPSIQSRRPCCGS